MRSGCVFVIVGKYIFFKTFNFLKKYSRVEHGNIHASVVLKITDVFLFYFIFYSDDELYGNVLCEFLFYY